MHLIERYALATASKIGKPTILKKFFPVETDKYITLQNSAGMPGKLYDYFQDAINLIRPYLEENNYKILQIGGPEDRPLDGCLHIQGKTTINQVAHVISNSSLHLGNDSFAIHMASAFDVPTVGLYSITKPEIAGPYWNNKKINLIPHDGHKPTFNPGESPKTVNLIKPEKVAESVLLLLQIAHKDLPKTIYIGNRYQDRIIETIPDQVIDPNFFKDDVLNIRLDYCQELNESYFNFMIQNIARRKCAIVTDRGFNTMPFMQFKQNLSMVIYEVTDNVEILFVEQMDKLGIPYVCVFNTHNHNQQILEERKFQLMEYCGIQEFKKIPDNIIEFTETSKFKTNRILLSNGKVYNSRACQLENLSINSSNDFIKINSIKNKNSLLEDLEFCLITE